MKYLRKFDTNVEYNSFIETTDDYPNVCFINEDGSVMFNPPPQPLYIEAIEDLTVSFGNTYEYSKDNVTWTTGNSETAILASTGEKVYFRASNLTVNTGSIGKFAISNKCNVGGNIMSMLYGRNFANKTEITKNYYFASIFSFCINIIDASKLLLPATTLTDYCYQGMFKGCTSLIGTPALPATTLKACCYDDMFRNCTSLMKAPELPATTLAGHCYRSMFYGCTSLVSVPELQATALAETCYYEMFRGCTALVVAPALPATTLAGSCYRAMFYGCKSLSTAPKLPATKLTTTCYYEMFNGCANLNYIKMLATDISASSCLGAWVSGVSATGTFVKNSAATWDKTGISGVPSGWTVEYADA
jgi:hypothetical protein